MAEFTSTITHGEDFVLPSDGTSTAAIYFSSENTWAAVRSEVSGDSVLWWQGTWSVDVNTDSTVSNRYDYLTRTGFVFEGNGVIPDSAYIKSAKVLLGIESAQSSKWSSEIDDFGIVVTSWTPVYSTGTPQLEDYNQTKYDREFSRQTWAVLKAAAPNSYVTFDLSEQGVQYLRDSMSSKRFTLGLRTTWDFDDQEPTHAANSGAFFDGGSSPGGLPPALQITYETPRDVSDDPRRRFELPATPQPFTPVNRRGGNPPRAPLTERTNTRLQTQVQDFLNEMPPLIMRNVAITPNSQVTAQAGTILVDPTLDNNNVWYKRVGSGNTGWIPLAFAYDDTGVGSAFSTAYQYDQFR